MLLHLLGTVAVIGLVCRQLLRLQLRLQSQSYESTRTYHYTRLNTAMPDSEFRPSNTQQAVTGDLEPLLEGYTNRFITIHDGSNGRMSVRWGMHGPNGRRSSGLN